MPIGMMRAKVCMGDLLTYLFMSEVLGGPKGMGEFKWLELRRLPPIMGFVGSAPGLVTLLGSCLELR
jgi:hypothetical protein